MALANYSESKISFNIADLRQLAYEEDVNILPTDTEENIIKKIVSGEEFDPEFSFYQLRYAQEDRVKQEGEIKETNESKSVSQQELIIIKWWKWLEIEMLNLREIKTKIEQEGITEASEKTSNINFIATSSDFDVSFGPYLCRSNVNGKKTTIFRDMDTTRDLVSSDFIVSQFRNGENFWLKQPLVYRVTWLPLAGIKLEAEKVVSNLSIENGLQKEKPTNKGEFQGSRPVYALNSTKGESLFPVGNRLDVSSPERVPKENKFALNSTNQTNESIGSVLSGKINEAINSELPDINYNPFSENASMSKMNSERVKKQASEGKSFSVRQRFKTENKDKRTQEDEKKSAQNRKKRKKKNSETNLKESFSFSNSEQAKGATIGKQSLQDISTSDCHAKSNFFRKNNQNNQHKSSSEKSTDQEVFLRNNAENLINDNLDLPHSDRDIITDLKKIDKKVSQSEQKKDKSMEILWDRARSGKADYRTHNELIFRISKDHLGNEKRQLIIPKKFRNGILAICHERVSAHVRATKSKDKRKFWFDRNTVVGKSKERDKVLVLATAKPNKLSVGWISQGTIVETNYVVNIPGRSEKEQIFHINLLEPYFGRTNVVNIPTSEKWDPKSNDADLGIEYPTREQEIFKFQDIVSDNDTENFGTNVDFPSVDQNLGIRDITAMVDKVTDSVERPLNNAKNTSIGLDYFANEVNFLRQENMRLANTLHILQRSGNSIPPVDCLSRLE